MRNYVSPCFTQFGTPTSPVVDIEEARKWVGLFEDTSSDDVLESLINAGESKVRRLSKGITLSVTQVTDFFPGLKNTQWFELSSLASEAPAIAIKYIGADNSSHVVPEASHNEIVIDRIGPNKKTQIKFDASDLEFSSDITYPLQITYNTGLVAGDTGLDQIRQAIRTYVFIAHNSRDPENLGGIDIDKILLGILSDYNLGVV